MKKKKQTMMDLTKETMGLGVASMAGLGTMGALSNVKGMPSQTNQVTQVASSGLTLANVGQLGKVGMAIPKMMSDTKKKKTGNKFIDKII